MNIESLLMAVAIFRIVAIAVKYVQRFMIKEAHSKLESD